MTEFFTTEMLLTFTGQVLFVTVATQVVKKYINVDPKWLSLGFSLVAAAVAQLVILKDFSAVGLSMAVINVFMVLSASIASYESIVKPVARGIEAEKQHEEFTANERGK